MSERTEHLGREGGRGFGVEFEHLDWTWQLEGFRGAEMAQGKTVRWRKTCPHGADRRETGKETVVYERGRKKKPKKKKGLMR